MSDPGISFDLATAAGINNPSGISFTKDQLKYYVSGSQTDDVFEFELSGLGAFPNLDRPRVIFVECRQLGRNSAMALQKSLGQEILIRAEIKLNRRPWTPHITLGRVKSRKSPGSIHCPIPNTEFRVPTFDLMESVLRPSGAEYKIIEKFNTNQ